MDEQRGLGRLPSTPEHAIRFDKYPLTALRPEVADPPARDYMYWPTGLPLDQNGFPHCVEYMWRQRVISPPVRGRWGWPAGDFYRECQRIDEWPGEQYDGTSVRAGADLLLRAGLVESYHWTRSAEEAANYLLRFGTLGFGTVWTEDMFRPDASGFIRPTGRVVGGHAYLAIGYSRKRGAFRFINSWSSSWGQRGRFWMTGEDVEKLIAWDGEVAAAKEVRR